MNDVFTYRVTDADGDAVTATLTIAISGVNDAPVADDETNTVTEDVTLTVAAASGLLAGDTDADGDSLTVTTFMVAGDLTVYNAGDTATIPGKGELTIQSDGSYVFDPAPNYAGSVPVATYTVSDGTTTDTGTLTLTVDAVPDAPAHHRSQRQRRRHGWQRRRVRSRVRLDAGGHGRSLERQLHGLSSGRHHLA